MAEPATLPPRPRASRARRAMSVVGPLFFYDVIRLARRGRSTLLRSAYALALLVNLYLAYHERFPSHDLLTAPFTPPRTVPPTELSRLAEQFVFSILWIQTAAIYVLTPAYLAGAVAEEKERKTLELLFTTHLLDREIVLGKLAARLMHLAGVLLAGVPLLVLTQLWGGVDIHLLTAAFVVTGLNLLSVGAVSIFCSVSCPTVTVGMLGSYLLAGGMFFVSSICPFGAVTNPVGLFETITEQASRTSAPTLVAPIVVAPTGVPDLVLCLLLGLLFHGSVAVFFAAAAVSNLRPAVGLPGLIVPERPGPRPAPRPAPEPQTPLRPAGFGYIELPVTDAVQPARRPLPPPPKPKPAEGWGPFGSPVPTSPRTPETSGKLPNLPPIGNWPLLWKETYRQRAVDPINERTVWLFFLGMPVALVVIALFGEMSVRDRMSEHSESLPRLAVLLTAGVWGVVLGFRAVAGISRERDNGTLEGLLTLPVSRAAILGAKWLGPVVYNRGFGIAVVLVIAAEVATGALHPVGAVLLALAVTAHMAFLTSLGVWLSLASRNTLWARVTMALALMVFLGIGLRYLLPAATSNALAVSSFSTVPVSGAWNVLPWKEYANEVGLNVPGTWWFLTFSPRQFADAMKAGDTTFVARMAVAEGAILAYGLAARLLWTLSCLRFRGEQRR